MLSPAIAMQIIVENKGDLPATVKIRHVYSGEWKDGKAEYSDWSTIELAGGESRTINHETTSYVYKGKRQEMSGFILFNDYLFNDMNMRHDNDSSSFELEITRRGMTRRLAGYDTKDGAFIETGLGDLKMVLDIPSMVTILHHKGGQDGIFFITIPYILLANLTIESNGTCKFEYTNIYESGNTEFPD
ncbi:MAG: hypothetical protein LBU28_02090 [Spirochaetaceae bacterium]|nr:hypothetical protein [Spirochaetaceae bacterium]